MLNAFLLAGRLLILVCTGHKQVALENIALRHQLAVFTREKKRPRRPRDRDRIFWIVLKKLWKDWRTALTLVQPETVIGWQRKRFKRYWRRLSQPRRPGRPRVYLEIRKLVRAMAAANPIREPRASTVSYLNHVIVLNDQHLRRLLKEYFRYYHESRTHLSLSKDAPEGRTIQSNKSDRIIQVPQVGGLHFRYERRTA